MSSTLKSNVVVVLDNGAGLCKAGIAGERDPQAVVPNCIGRLAHSATTTTTTTENNKNNNNSNNNNNNNNNKDNINSTSSSSSSSSSNKKWLIADQLVSCEDLTSVSVRRPYDRGYLINPDLQKEIWERLMSSVLRVDPCSSSLLLVQPLFSLPSINRSMYELVFEDLSFRSLFISNSPSLVHLYQSSLLTSNSNSNSNSTISTSTSTSTTSSTFSRSQCSLVVDCGFSFCHAAPVLHNFTLNYAVRRLDLGGKALTNYLKELISFRSLNVMDETFLVDDIKEKLCFVSLDLPRHLHASRKRGKDNLLKCSYVLPDGVNYTKGFVKDMNEANRYLTLQDGKPRPEPTNREEGLEMDEQDEKPRDRNTIDLTKNEITLTNERFLVPEMLFRPADLGMNEAGLAECIVRSVEACHPHLHPLLYENIILTGGSTLFPNFAQRLEQELRPLVRDDYPVKIMMQEDPIRGVWRGGSLLASSPDFEDMCVSKSEYEELGSHRCHRRFFH